MRKDVFNPIFDERGLLVAAVIDWNTKKLLMVAYMNKEALNKTIETGYGHFFSRKRQALWKKGESSGNFLKVHKIMVDCDQDCIQLLVDVEGDGKACHTGADSCFYRVLENGHLHLRK